MEESGIISWLAYRRDRVRRKIFRRRAGYILLVNVAIIITFGALLVFLFERGRNPNIHGYWDALWFTFISIATVGYGDIVPVTNGGRVVIILTIVLGIGTLSAFITMLATNKVEKTRRRYRGLERKAKVRDHILICGWNLRGKYVLARLREELKSKHIEIVLLCGLEESPVYDDSIFFFRGDPTSRDDLRRVNVVDSEAVILLADESKGGSSGDVDARTVLAALTIRDLNPDVKMTAEALEPENIHHLELAGVEEILDTNAFLGNLLARSALHYGLINTVSELVTRQAGTNNYIIPAGEEMVGRTRAEVAAELEEKYGSRLVAITSGKTIRPGDEGYVINEGDSLIVISEDKPPGARG